MRSNHNRVPAGVRTGGQFTHAQHAAAGLRIDADDNPRAAPIPTAGRSTAGCDAARDPWSHVCGADSDRPDGTPADMTFHDDGSVATWLRAGDRDRSHFPAGGTISHLDPRDGSHVAVSPNEGGQCTRRGRVAPRVSSSVPPVGAGGSWRQSPPEFDELRDGPGGEPAVVYTRPDGSVSSLTRYRDGDWTHTVDFDRAGEPVVVFTNAEHPAVQGFPADDPVWTDIGLNGSRWAGTRPAQALTAADSARVAGGDVDDVAVASRAAGGWPPPGPMPAPAGCGRVPDRTVARRPRRPAGLRRDQLDAWEGEAADWYGGPDDTVEDRPDLLAPPGVAVERARGNRSADR